MLLLDKTELERRAIGRYKATKSFKNFFYCFKQTLVILIALTTPSKAISIEELLAFPPSRMTHTEYVKF